MGHYIDSISNLLTCLINSLLSMLMVKREFPTFVSPQWSRVMLIHCCFNIARRMNKPEQRYTLR
jgi:hypothetical protein